MQLFRPEVLESRTAHWIGPVRISRPVGFSFIAVLAGGCLVSVVTFLCLGTVSRKAQLDGILVPVRGMLHLVAPSVGVVSEIKVAEGDFVKAGEVVAIIRRNRESLVGGTLTDVSGRVLKQVALRRESVGAQRMLRHVQAEQKLAGLERRASILDAEVQETRQEAELIRRRLELARSDVERLSALSERGFVSHAQLQARQEEVLELTARLHSLDRSRLVLERERLSYKEERTQIRTQLKAELLQFEQVLGLLDQESIEQSVNDIQVITAPFAGTITAANVEAGQAVGSGRTVMVMVPSENGGAELQAELFAASKTVGLIEIGQEVHIRYAAFPFQRYGTYRGYVHSISSSPTAPGELQQRLGLPALSRIISEPSYRVTVTLKGQTVHDQEREYSLKPGFMLEAQVIADETTLGQLLFAPLFASHARL